MCDLAHTERTGQEVMQSKGSSSRLRRRRCSMQWALIALETLTNDPDRNPAAFLSVGSAPLLHGTSECNFSGSHSAEAVRRCRIFRRAHVTHDEKWIMGRAKARCFLAASVRRRERRDRGLLFAGDSSELEVADGSGSDPTSVSGEGAGDMDMAPVDLEQAMGSFSPEWGDEAARENPMEHLIKGSVISGNQTVFPYRIDSFPPLINSEVYYNGTSEKFWWNQNAEAVCVYVPVTKGFDPQNVEFVAKTKQISLKLDGEEIISGTPFYRVDGYESLFVLDAENDPPYVQLELYKVREYQNWEDLIIETSSFSPGGAQ